MRFISVLTLALSAAAAVHAGTFSDELSGMSLTLPDVWTLKERAKDPAQNIRMKIECKGENYMMVALFYGKRPTGMSVEAFRDQTTKAFPKDWIVTQKPDVLIGTARQRALHACYVIKQPKAGELVNDTYFVGTEKSFLYIHTLCLSKNQVIADKVFSEMLGKVQFPQVISSEDEAPSPVAAAKAVARPGAESIVGRWIVRKEKGFVLFAFNDAGQFEGEVNNGEGSDKAAGRYRLEGRRVFIEPINDKPGAFDWSFERENLILVGDGKRMVFMRAPR